MKKTYNYSIKNSTFEIKKATLKGKNYLVCLNYYHAVAGKSTNNDVESSKSPVIMGFFHAQKTSEYTLDTFLDTFL